MIAWHLAKLEDRMYVNLEGGKKAAMPRYYKQKIYSDLQRKRIAFFHAQKLMQEQREAMDANPDYWADKAIVDEYKWQRMAAFADKNNKI